MISIQEMSFHYKKQQELFSSFSFRQENGSIAGLLGKNGAGKTTLLKLIAGLLAPKGGQLKINGYEPFERNPSFLESIYFVPEEFILSPVTISCYVKATAPLYPDFDYEKMAQILKDFELASQRNINKLSHGQRKKFLIAFALSTNCKLLILDEPTNGLDIPSKSLFRKVLIRSVTDEQLVLISTHQVKDVETIIEKVLVLDEGKIILDKDMDEISQQWKFLAVDSLAVIESPLYYERCPSGFKVMLAADQQESEVDLELLFNALVKEAI